MISLTKLPNALVVTLCFIAAASSHCVAQIEQDELAVLHREVALLESRIVTLEREAEIDDRLDAVRLEEMRRLVEIVVADAYGRASHLGSEFSAGHDGGFFLTSADGSARLVIDGRIQARYVLNRQGAPPAGGDRYRSGFENRRTQIAVSGRLWESEWSFKVQGAFGRGEGDFTLLDAFVDRALGGDWLIRIGQFRHLFLKEDSTSSGRQLAVERSLVNSRFAQNRGQGVELRATAGDDVRWSVMFGDGLRSTIGHAGRGSNTPWSERTTEFALTGRVEYRAAGNWRQTREFTSWADEPFGLFLGAAGHWQRDAYGTADDVTEMLRWTADIMMKLGGGHAFLALIGNHEDTKAGGRVDQYGLIAQGGIFIVPDRWELFTRYEWGDADGLGKDLSVITVGVNRYFAGHRIKWTSDVGIGINEVAPFWATSGAGFRSDRPGESGQLVVRSQLQMLF